jgi:hypothetical protein
MDLLIAAAIGMMESNSVDMALSSTVVPTSRAVYTNAEQDAFFNAIGLPNGTPTNRTESTTRWQEASTWSTLDITGVFDAATTADANIAVANGHRISPHFALSEFACPEPSNPDCKIMQVHSELIVKLEQVLADGYPNGITIISGYRDPTYNASLPGSSSTSAHMYGLAIDFSTGRGPDWFTGRGFHGIEVRTSSGYVSHLDLQTGLAEDTVFYV